MYDADAAQFRQQLAEADLLDAVEDAGWVEEEVLPALLSRADVGLYLMEDTLLQKLLYEIVVKKGASCAEYEEA